MSSKDLVMMVFTELFHLSSQNETFVADTKNRSFPVHFYLIRTDIKIKSFSFIAHLKHICILNTFKI